MIRNHPFTAKIWQNSRVRALRHALSVNRVLRHLSANHRRLPDYVIVGAQKAGTTSLWAYLNEHPQIELALTKEMSFFDIHYQRGASWYRMHFPIKPDSSVSTTPERRTLTGESSAYYMFHPLAANRLAELVPSAKIICLLRNPVDRAFSHYQLKCRRRQEWLPFEEAIAAEEERLAGEEQKLRSVKGYYSESHDRYSYLARGRYLEQLVRWQQVFPAEQLLIVESGELFKHTDEVYQRVLRFLDLPSWRPAQFGNRFPGKYQEKMSAATRRHLVDYFAPHNEQLYRHLNARFDWDR
jgi:hypothetical protein